MIASIEVSGVKYDVNEATKKVCPQKDRPSRPIFTKTRTEKRDGRRQTQTCESRPWQ